MECGTVPTTLGFEIADQSAISRSKPPVLTVVAAHPFLSQGECAEAVRVGCVIPLDGARDRAPQPFVLRPGEMPLQEFRNGQIGGHDLQRFIKPVRMRK
jgi:hypothetical protein